MKLVVIIIPKIKNIIENFKLSDIEKYVNYWKSITPQNDTEIFDRFVFSFLSVHTPWEANVSAYQMLKNNPWKTEEELRQLIIDSRVGLQKNRTRGIWSFKKDFEVNPNFWKKQPEESWITYRNRIEERLFGLAYAKTSFAIELIYPIECEVTCLDVHMLRLLEYPKLGTAPNYKNYRFYEDVWYSVCKSNKVPCFIARNLYWDTIQNQTDPRYWTKVFEK